MMQIRKTSLKNVKQTAIEQVVFSQTIIGVLVEKTAENLQDKTIDCFGVVTEKGALYGVPVRIARNDVDINFVKGSLNLLVGTEIGVVVTATDPAGDYLICSRVLAQQSVKQDMLEEVKSGTEYEGQLLSYMMAQGGFITGAFVGIGPYNSLVGLLRDTGYTSDHSHINEHLKIGDKVKVKCLSCDGQERILWECPEKVRRPVGTTYSIQENTSRLGRVRSMPQFKDGNTGVFVTMEDGLDALCQVPDELAIEVGAQVVVVITKVTRTNDDPSVPPRIKGRITRML